MLFIVTFVDTFAQSNEVKHNLILLSTGKTEIVRAAIPELLARYPNDAGIMLLHGSVIEDSELSLEIFKRIVSDHAVSEWADDAQWRIILHYAVAADTTKAKYELELLRAKHPNSAYLIAATDLVRSAINFAKNFPRGTVMIAQDAPIVAEPVKQDLKPVIVADKPTNIADTKPSENVIIDNKLKEIYPEPDTKAPVMKDSVMNIQIDEPKNEIEVLSENKPKEVFYGLQVGIYNDKASAEAEKEKFLAKRMRTTVTEKEIGGKLRYAVVIGHYSSKDAAEAAKIIVGQQCECVPLIYEK